MYRKIEEGVIAGFFGTLVMTFLMYFGTLVNLPKTDDPSFMGGWFGLTGAPQIFVGLLFSFLFGFIFATIYVFAYNRMGMTSFPAWLKGGIFGLFPFAICSIMVITMSTSKGGGME